MRSVRVVGVSVLLMASLVACGGSGGKAASTTLAKRPTTSARLQILEPTPNQVTGPNITVKVNLIGATIVPATNTAAPKNGNEGHIHVLVDGKVVQMAYQAQQDITGLAPGQHNLTAQFVATDHLAFANPVQAAVLFTVQG